MNLSELKNKILKTKKLLKIDEQKKELTGLESEMNAPDFWSDQNNAGKVSKKYQDIKDEVDKWENLESKVSDLIELESSNDKSLEEEIKKQGEDLEKEFKAEEFYLMFDGVHDKDNAIVSIHAGSGGTEAQDWAEMLLRMVLRFCEKQNFKTEILDESKGQEAGYKSVMIRVEGKYAYGYLQSEHGVHRLVRISPFDAEKMRHTSFASIEVLPEIDDEIDIQIDEKDLRIDTFNSSGAGGQSVNTAYSAVRIVHIPTNISVSCQNERSQTQNKETAMKILKSKLQTLEEEKLEAEKQVLRGEQKSVEWGSQIRSYVIHPYHMVKDLRSDYETSDTQAVLDGGIKEFSEAFLRWKKQK